MFWVYILQSQKHGRYYIGSCASIDNRLERHNSARVKSTRNGIPWFKVHQESFETRQEAYKREFQIKSYKGGEAFKKLII